MFKFKIRDKLLIGFGSVLLVLMCIGLYSIYTLRNVTNEAEQMDHVHYAAAITSFEMSSEINSVQQWLTDISATRGLDGLNDGFDEAEKAAVSFKEHMVSLKAIFADDATLIKELNITEEEFDKYYEVGKEMANGYVEGGPAVGNKLMAAFDEVAETIHHDMDGITERNMEEFTHSMTALEEHTVTSRNVSIALLVIGFIISILAIIILSRQIITPLRRTVEMVRDIAEGEGDLTKRLDDSGKDELSELAKWFNVFTNNLQAMIGKMSQNAKGLTVSSEQLSEVAENMEGNILTMSTESSAVLESSEAMTRNISDIAITAGDTSGNVTSVSAAVEEMSQNMVHISESTNSASANGTSVAAAIEEMSSTLNEISKNTGKGARISAAADEKSSEIKTLMDSLGESTRTVSEVVEVINDIADRTNILALNATIEAASAGEAGKGFAVVANEVKELSKQTAKATGEVVSQIDAMQASTGAVVKAVDEITSVIKEINKINITIAAAVEEQDATTTEVSKATSETVNSMAEASRNVEEAATGAEEVARNTSELSIGVEGISSKISDTAEAASDVTKRILNVNNGVEEAFVSAKNVKSNADKLQNLAEKLYQIVGEFKIDQSFVASGELEVEAKELMSSSTKPMIEWSDRLSVHVKSMDAQHKRLVALVNKLYEAMNLGKSKDVMGTILKDLVGYTENHFKDEEKLLKKYGYSGLSGQQKEHAALVTKVKDLEVSFSSGRGALTMDVMVFLKDWLSKHIMGDDKEYGVYLNSKGVN